MATRKILLTSLIAIFTLILCGCGRSYHIKGRVIFLSELQTSAGFIVEFTGKDFPQGGMPISGAKVVMFHQLNKEDKPMNSSDWRHDTETDGSGFFDTSDYATPSSESKVGLEVSKKGYKTIYTTYIDYSNIEPQEFLVVLVPETQSDNSTKQIR